MSFFSILQGSSSHLATVSECLSRVEFEHVGIGLENRIEHVVVLGGGLVWYIFFEWRPCLIFILVEK